jgi:hypothetical protein
VIGRNRGSSALTRIQVRFRARATKLRALQDRPTDSHPAARIFIMARNLAVLDCVVRCTMLTLIRAMVARSAAVPGVDASACLGLAYQEEQCPPVTSERFVVERFRISICSSWDQTHGNDRAISARCRCMDKVLVGSSESLSCVCDRLTCPQRVQKD